VNVRTLEERGKSRQFRLYVALAHLQIEEEECVPRRCPRRHALYQSVGHAQAVHAVAPRALLRHCRDQMQCGLHRRGGIRLVPPSDFLVQPREHLLGRKLSQDPHPPGERVSVVGHDAMPGEDRPRERLRPAYRPLRRRVVGQRSRPLCLRVRAPCRPCRLRVRLGWVGLDRVAPRTLAQGILG
jgi:hypothetical protein